MHSTILCHELRAHHNALELQKAFVENSSDTMKSLMALNFQWSITLLSSIYHLRNKTHIQDKKGDLIRQIEWSKEPHHGAHPNVPNLHELKTFYFIALSWVINTRSNEFESRVYCTSTMTQGLAKLVKTKVESKSKNIDLEMF